MRQHPLVPIFFLGLIVFLVVMVIALAPRNADEAGDAAGAVARAAAQASPEPGSIAAAVLPATETPAPVPPPTETAVPFTPEPTATRQVLPAAVQKDLHEIQYEAASMRGLSAMTDVPETLITRAQFREYLKKEMQKYNPVEDIRRYVHQLWMLRLVNSPSIDWYEASADINSDGILGYYDPHAKEMFVITDKLKLDPRSKVTVAHEQIHNLQDQNYNLEKMMPTDTTDGDRSLAYRALVEGDATLSGFSWAYYYMGKDDYERMFDRRENISTDVINRTPRYLSEITIFPYSEGPAFVNKLMDVSLFSTVNLALSDPPRSTEQILHPEKFLQTPIDQPISVSLPPLTSTLGAGWTFKETNTLGELEVKILLEENGASDPARGAAGWGGGRYAYYQNGEATLAYSVVTWDTEADAIEFEGAMGETFAKYPKDGSFWTDAGRFFALKRDRLNVTFISSSDRGALERALTAK